MISKRIIFKGKCFRGYWRFITRIWRGSKQDSPKFMNGVYGPAQSSYQRYMRRNVQGVPIPNSHRFAKPRKETKELFSCIDECFAGSDSNYPKNEFSRWIKKRGVDTIK